jgi:hypothetical protein
MANYLPMLSLARIIHEDFYYNRRYAATTGLMTGGLAAQSVNILFKYASLLRGHGNGDILNCCWLLLGSGVKKIRISLFLHLNRVFSLRAKSAVSHAATSRRTSG